MRSTASIVTRQSIGKFSLTGDPAHIVVRINGDSLEFREKGSRRTFRLPLEHAARQAVLHTAEALPILQPITVNLGPLPEGLKPEPDPMPAPASTVQQALL